MEGYKKIQYNELTDNIIKLIGKDWMLISAGKVNEFNMMTASWGGMGWIWEKPVSFIFIRPQRYTLEFIEKEDFYTVCFFTEEYRKELTLLGTKSGKEINKIKDSGLSAIKTEHGSIAFSEARIILECKKLFATHLKEDDFITKELVPKIYPTMDFHKMFIGEILGIWTKE